MKKNVLLLGLAMGFILVKAQNVGIGEPNPGSKLSVKGGLSVGGAYSAISAPDGTMLLENKLGIGTTSVDSNAILDIRSTTKGIILPRMSKEQRESIANPAQGLLVFDTDSNTLFFHDGSHWFNFPALDLVNNTVHGMTSNIFSSLGITGGGLLGGGSSSGTAWSTGTTAPTVLTAGNIGDFYINTADGKLYKKTSAVAWTLQGDLTGPTGEDGRGYGSTTSSSSVSIATGNKTFTVADLGAFVVGSRVRAAYSTDPDDKYMEGVLASKTSTTITIDVDLTEGSGSYNNWNFSIAGNRGATGATGAAGTNGATGATGAQGPAGVQGVAGAAGAAGANGTNGATWLNGTTAPTGGQGIVNDFFLNTSNGTFYKKTAASTWTSQGSLRGVTGSTGATGAAGTNGINGATGAQGIQGVAGVTGAAGTNGTNGTNGATWLNGSSAPTGGQGSLNDFFLNSSNGTFYKKTGASVWSSQGSLKGATGATGTAGTNGTNGTNGANGATGAAGSNGTNGATWLNGAAAPTGGQGILNDFFLNTSNGTYYKKTGASAWTSQGSLRGATGATGTNGTNGTNGATGAAGTNGTNGATWLNGTVAPTGGQGILNDFFLNGSNGTFYKKTGASAWTSQGSLRGATGATGSNGVAGATGATGATGAGLSNGSAAGNTPYWNGSSWIFNSSNIYNNGGNVGIGTTSPSQKLDVQNGSIYLSNNNNTATSIMFQEPSSSGSNYTSFKAQAQAANITYTLPATQSANSVLTNDGNGNLKWDDAGTVMFKKKSSNESMTSNTTLQDDNDFTYSLAANQTYEVFGILRMSASSTGEFKFQFTGPTGTAVHLNMGYNTSAQDELFWVTSLNSVTDMLSGGADGTTDVVYVQGIITTGSTAGTFKLQWAQNVSHSTATTIYANSFIKLTRME